jgi:hypothetical protein
MGRGNWVQWILQGVLEGRLRPPGYVIELLHVFVVHEAAADVPDTYSIINTEARTLRCSKNVFTIRAPLAMGAVGCLNGADFAVVLFQIVNVHMASQISKAGDKDEATVWGEKNSVSGSKVKVMLGYSASVEDSRLGRHVTIHDSKLLGVGRPGHVMDRALLVCSKMSIRS